MKGTLHIVKKDLKRHWPEILISLILLGEYVKLSLRGQLDYTAFAGFPWWRLSEQIITPALPLFWVFLTVRLVQGEALVGDRQWWVTKPYEWWKLLLAKELFLFVCVSVPLFLVQLFLLIHAGFPVLPNIKGVLNMQLGLGIFLFLPGLALGSLTKNLGQALLGVVVVFLTFTGVVWLLQQIPNNSMSSAADSTEAVQGWLSIGSVIGAAGWQYARRKTWASRGILCGGMAAVALIGAVTPYGTFVERKYSVVEGSEAPAQFAVRVVPRNTKVSGLEGSLRDAYLTIPLTVSGIAPGKVLLLQGIKATIETPEGVRLDAGWSGQWSDVWPDDDRRNFLYRMNRNVFEKIKTEVVRVHLELALTEYQETEVKELVLQEGKFSDPELGICELQHRDFSQLECRRPFRNPGLMATFDPAEAKCAAEEDDYSTPEDKVSHAWYAPSKGDGPEPGLNPVFDYPVAFARASQVLAMRRTRGKVRVARLCWGAKVRLAKPEENRHVRVKAEMGEVRLLDLISAESFE